MEMTKIKIPILSYLPLWLLKRIPGIILKNKRGWYGIVLNKYRVFWMIGNDEFGSPLKAVLGYGYLVDDCHDYGKVIGHIWFRSDIYHMAMNTKE